MTVEHLGWSPFFARHFEPFASTGLRPARVVRQDKGGYLVQSEGDPVRAVLAGSLRDSPAVGDWVGVEQGPSASVARIQAVLPRTSVFSRKEAGRVTREQVVAANVDTAFLISGLDGDFNLRRIERYVAQTWSSGAEPVILLNKADLRNDVEALRLQVEATAPGIAVHIISALQADNLGALDSYLTPGRTVVFLGSSGAGKSTLLNRLLGREQAKTAEVRADDSRGRHTTTHRELFVLPGGGIVIDTPGLRELQLWAPVESLGGSFSDVEELAAACRYRDCTHEREPGCAVQAAVEEGLLDQGRYGNYLKMQKELAYLERRQKESYDHDERRRGRKGSLQIREILRQKRR